MAPFASSPPSSNTYAWIRSPVNAGPSPKPALRSPSLGTVNPPPLHWSTRPVDQSIVSGRSSATLTMDRPIPRERWWEVDDERSWETQQDTALFGSTDVREAAIDKILFPTRNVDGASLLEAPVVMAFITQLAL